MDITISDDYAVMNAGSERRFYYGYESVDADGEWCFEANIDGGRVKFGFNDLGLHESRRFEPAECLLAGIGQLFERGFVSGVES